MLGAVRLGAGAGFVDFALRVRRQARKRQTDRLPLSKIAALTAPPQSIN